MKNLLVLPFCHVVFLLLSSCCFVFYYCLLSFNFFCFLKGLQSQKSFFVSKLTHRIGKELPGQLRTNTNVTNPTKLEKLTAMFSTCSVVFRKVPPKHPHCPLCSQLNCLIGIKFKCLILPFPKHKRSNILNSFVSSRKRLNGCWFAVQFSPEVLGNCPSSSDHFIKCSPFPQYTIFYGGEVQKWPEVSESFGRKKRRGRNGCWFAVQSRK